MKKDAAVLYQLSEATDTQMMSYILLNEQGKIAVIDGGNDGDGEKLFRFLQKLGGERPVIEKWFLTHFHGDHINALTHILRKYRDQLDIRNVCYNFSPDEDALMEDPREAFTVEGFHEVREYFKDREIILHTGDEISFGNISFTVMFMPDPSVRKNIINNGSTVLRCDIGSQRVLFLGDLGEEVSEQFLTMWSEEDLHSDFVQMSHHGQNGAPKEVYEKIRPKACLWPTPKWLWDNDAGDGIGTGPWNTLKTRAWMQELSVKHHFITHLGDQEIHFPYDFQEEEKKMHDFGRYNSIRPGKTWLDTEGKRIQAHGGSVLYVDGTYYWYGENKEFTTGDNDIWTWGVRCYASKDLYNWEDKGLIILPETGDENSSLCPTTHMLDRPHIIYNRKTGKYVCWMKIMHKNGSQTETVMTADNILGPYEMVREGLRPLGMDAGDFDLAVAPDGKAYYYFERVHSETICADLTDDYTDVTGYYSTHFPHVAPPHVREATAHFVREGKHYLLTSGTTGYLPNPTEEAVAETWHGPYRVLGDPHVNDESSTSFHSQISCIFKVEGKKDLYIACADRWLPEKMDLNYDEYKILFEKCFDPKDVSETEKEQMLKRLTEMGSGNISIADYVWLPLRFDGEMVRIDWLDEWRIEDYE